MVRGRRLVALIPARGGSKGIPGKNLFKIEKMTLVERAVKLARSHSAVDQAWVSTDHPEIYKIAQSVEAATPRLRPAHLATDQARTVDVVRHLVEEGLVNENDVLLLLQPTSPLRTLKSLEAVISKFEKSWEEADAVISVAEVVHPHPYKTQKIENGYLKSIFGHDSSVARQSLPKAYSPNGAFYLNKVKSLLDENTFVPKRSLPEVMGAEESINLDSDMDLLLLKAILKKNGVQHD